MGTKRHHYISICFNSRLSGAARTRHSRLHVLSDLVLDKMFVVGADAGQNLDPRGPPHPKLVKELQTLSKSCSILDAGKDTTQDAAVLDGLVGALPAEWKHLEISSKLETSTMAIHETWHSYRMSSVANQYGFAKCPG